MTNKLASELVTITWLGTAAVIAYFAHAIHLIPAIASIARSFGF